MNGKKFYYLFTLLSLVALSLWAIGCGPATIIDEKDPTQKGQTSFTSEEELDQVGNAGGRDTGGVPERGGVSAGSSPNSDRGGAGSSKGAAPPSGRTDAVEEADLYKVHGKLLFYLNTYKGLMLFDLADPRSPKKLYNLPVYGYPIEMFFDGNTAYVLVRDALYLLKKRGKLQFEKRNVSQLITIDISNPRAPKILQRLDIKGKLREGVSRKIGKTIYVASYHPRWYWWGWRYGGYSQPKKDMLYVYSFDISDPKNVKMIQSLQLIKDKSFSKYKSGIYESLSFQGVTVSATSNTFLVVEKWYYSRSVYRKGERCGEYKNSSYSVVNIVDVSDPSGKIKVHTRFKLIGIIGDQFKQTYIYDKAKNRGLYLAILQRMEWNWEDCKSNRVVKNTLYSVDVTDGTSPKILDEIDFGKPNETVRASLYDRDREVVYAITARAMDPLYVLSFKDPHNLKILSEIDGLSGDMNVFRFIENKKFLLGIGRDNTSTCKGFGTERVNTRMALSIIDVRDLHKIRLVQRQCITIPKVRWMSSQINWNLDQAHKMIGMYSKNGLNLLTIPISYYVRNEKNYWYWYEYRSAVGIMKWDLSKYDPNLPASQQNVIQYLGTVKHPKGSVKRTIIFELPLSGGKKRMIANLSDTHLSLADIDNPSSPQLLSTLELAPFYKAIYRFGDYVVQQVTLGQYYEQYNEFRVKKLTSGNIEDAPTLSSIVVGRLRRTLRVGNYLLIFRYPIKIETHGSRKYIRYIYDKSEMIVLDYTDPLRPKIRGLLRVDKPIFPYYFAYCGLYSPYMFDYYTTINQWLTFSDQIVGIYTKYDYRSRTQTVNLFFIDLSNPDKPKFRVEKIATNNYQSYPNVVGKKYYISLQKLDDKTFFINYREIVRIKNSGSRKIAVTRYFAQKWDRTSGWNWKKGADINIPGNLLSAYRKGQKILFLTTDNKRVKSSNGSWYYTRRLFLLEYLPSIQAASLKDFTTISDWSINGLLFDTENLYLTGRKRVTPKSTKSGASTTSSGTAAGLGLIVIKVDANTGFKRGFQGDTGIPFYRLMGVYQRKLFLNLPGDGVLVIDTSDYQNPKALHFKRTLGWLTHVEFSKDRAFMAAGHFGIYQVDLNTATIPSL